MRRRYGDGITERASAGWSRASRTSLELKALFASQKPIQTRTAIARIAAPALTANGVSMSFHMGGRVALSG